MPDPLNNSHRAKQESNVPAKMQKVVVGEVVPAKKNWRKRMAESFFAGRADSVGELVFWEVMIPSLKTGLDDMLTTFKDQMFYGGQNTNRRPSQRGNNPTQSYVSYNGISSGMKPDPREVARQRSPHDFDDYVFKTRAEADAVLGEMLYAIREYNAVSIADFKESIGLTGSPVDQDWGWSDIRGAGVTRLTSGGFVLNLPRPKPLD